MEKIATDIYTFEELRTRGYTYVDKTAIIEPLANFSIGKQFFLARPRRFGKSLLVSTLRCLFEGRRDLFQGLAIEPNWDWSKKWPVIHLDMGTCQAGTIAELREFLFELMRSEANRLNVPFTESSLPSVSFRCLIESVAKTSPDGQCVVLIDEYDKPILGHLTMPDITQFRNELKPFYGVVKYTESKQRFTFITGISKFSKVSVFSDLNNLKDRTMSSKEATLLGYTHDEVRRYFPNLIAALGEKYGYDFETTFKLLVHKYNGYRFEENAETVMNPVSLGCCLEEQKFGDYWSMTAVPTFLIDILKQHPLNFKTIDLEQNALDAYEPEKPTIETLLYQTGYLTIKSARMVGVNLPMNEPGWLVYTLGFPNQEVEKSFIKMLVPAYVGMENIPCNNAQRTAGEALQANDIPTFFKALKSFFYSIPYSLTDRQNEQMWQTIVWTVLKGVGIYVGAEIQTADGRIDMVVDTPNRVFILEFKLNDTAENAIAQIKDMRYYAPYETSSKGITLLGVGFSSEQRTITDTAEEVLK